MPTIILNGKWFTCGQNVFIPVIKSIEKMYALLN